MDAERSRCPEHNWMYDRRAAPAARRQLAPGARQRMGHGTYRGQSSVTPGAAWLAITRESDPARFDAAFVENVRLDLAVLDDPMTGASEIRRYLHASREVFPHMSFTHQR